MQVKASVRANGKRSAEVSKTATPSRRTPKTLRSILLATDFSKAAAHAGLRAAQLPLTSGCKITVLHAARSEAEAKDEYFRQRLAADAESLGEALLAAGVSSPRVATTIAVGKPSEVIVRSIHEVDMLVLGRHGAGGLSEFLLGSTAERVVHAATAPVLVVGPKRLTPYRRVIVGVDLSPTSLTALELAMTLVPDGSVEIVYVYERLIERALLRSGCPLDEIAERRAEAKRDAVEALATFLEPLGDATADCTRVVRADDPRVALLNQATRRRADLLVVGARRQSQLTSVLLGSVATTVLRHAECDVLVVPGTKKPPPSRRARVP